jgi:hypothetical protein
MSAEDPLAPYYTAANEKAREIVTLIKTAEAYDSDPDGHAIRGQIRQHVRDATPLQVWLLIEVLARSVAATYEDLDEWSAAVIAALATTDDDTEETP